jgi:hypothetical protein
MQSRTVQPRIAVVVASCLRRLANAPYYSAAAKIAIIGCGCGATVDLAAKKGE